MAQKYELTIYPISTAVVVDEITGQLRAATPEELAELNARMDRALRHSMALTDPDEWYIKESHTT
jgi:hypothetical protein